MADDSGDQTPSDDVSLLLSKLISAGGLRECPSCRKDTPRGVEVRNDLAGPKTLVLTCDNCGFISQHAVGLIGHYKEPPQSVSPATPPKADG